MAYRILLVDDVLLNRKVAKVKQSCASAASMQDQIVIGTVTAEEVAAIKCLTNRKAELKLQLKRLIDMDKEELYWILYDRIIQEMGEVSMACEQWWDEKYDKYQWANIVGDEIELDYDNGQVLVKNMIKEGNAHQAGNVRDNESES